MYFPHFLHVIFALTVVNILLSFYCIFYATITVNIFVLLGSLWYYYTEHQGALSQRMNIVPENINFGDYE
jgi:hypothetical protein